VLCLCIAPTHNQTSSPTEVLFRHCPQTHISILPLQLIVPISHDLSFIFV
jgi:hypothetical protein